MNEQGLSRQNQQEQKQQSIYEALGQLDSFSRYIQQRPNNPIQHLKQYITIYVQNHKRSQQFFHHMCEHNMIAKLFSFGSNIVKPIFILQVFNLLLANTNQFNQLIYVFSHPLFHNFLFNNFDPLKQSTQCIQYYIQLLKTIILKLQQQKNTSLLKLFCNSKYLSFPLLLNSIILSLKKNVKQQLVRITGQHCILKLIEIVNKKHVGQCYLLDVHMLIFFYQIIQQMLNEQIQKNNNNEQSTMKYIMDLLKCIQISSQEKQTKNKCFLMFFTILANSIVFKFYLIPSIGLHILFRLSNSFSQTQQLYYLPSVYLTPIYSMYGKILFNKYVNNITLSTLINITQNIQIMANSFNKDVNIFKIVKTYYQKHNQLSQKIQNCNRMTQSIIKSYSQDNFISNNNNSLYNNTINIISNNNNSFYTNSINNKYKRKLIFQSSSLAQLSQQQRILQQIQKYNQDNQQISQLKQNYYKKSQKQSNSSFGWIGSLLKKISYQIQTLQYIKKVSLFVSVKFEYEKTFNFLQNISLSNSMFLYQYFSVQNKLKYNFGQVFTLIQKTQINFNENRDLFQIDKQFLKVIYNIIELSLIQIDSIKTQLNRKQLFRQLQTNYHKQLSHPGQIYFVLHFRKYLISSLNQFIISSCNTPRVQLNFSVIKLMYKILFSLQIQSQIQLHDKFRIQTEILNLEKQIFNLTKQNGFDKFCEYIQTGLEKKMVEDTEKGMTMSKVLFHTQTILLTNFSSPKKKNKLSLLNIQKSKINKKSPNISNSNKKNTKQSPQKNYQAKYQNYSFMVFNKCLYLQLLRYIKRSIDQYQLKQNPNNNKNNNNQTIPLYKIFESEYRQKYQYQIKNSLPVIFIKQKINFKQNQSEQQNNYCTFTISVSLSSYQLSCQLTHIDKIFIRSNLSQLQLENVSFNPLIIKIKNTNNYLQFTSKEQSLSFCEQIEKKKFQFKQLMTISVLKYLKKDINLYQKQQ